MGTDPLFMKIGADYYFYHNDHIGTPQKMTSVSGAVVWSAKYSSFGEASVDVGTVTNNLRFAGQYYDQEAGLHYNFNRYYNSATGRYLTPDPVGVEGGVNLFSYVDNNPLQNTDPTGLIKWRGSSKGATIFTAGMYFFKLESECVDGKKGTVTVVFAGPGLGIGMDFSGTNSDVTLEDPFDFVNPSSFSGTGYIAQAGLSWPPDHAQKLGQVLAGESDLPHGAGCSTIGLGCAFGTGCGDLWGINLSLEALYGSSTVWDSKIECCNE